MCLGLLPPVWGTLMEILVPGSELAVTVTCGIDTNDSHAHKVVFVCLFRTVTIAFKSISLLKQKQNPNGLLLITTFKWNKALFCRGTMNSDES